MEEIKRMVGSSRLVTLTGAGGSGKTRLALQVAGQVLDRFTGGVWLAGFAPLSESTQFHQALASILQVREDPGNSILQTLMDHLYPRNLLLLFDNCEHVIAECALTAERLLRACPQLRILATSREALNVPGEEQFYVTALSLPEAQGTASLEILMQSEAVRLFVERAQAVKHDFTLTSQNAGAVLQICPGVHGRTLDIEKSWPQVDHSVPKEVSHVEYKTPFNLAITQDGRRLFVACEESNSLIILDVESGTVRAEIPVGMQPHFVLLSPDVARAYVSNRGSDAVSVVDVAALRVEGAIAVGDEPHEMATNAAGTLLYVANAGTYDVSVVDLAARREVKRLAALRGPWGLARSPDGRQLYVTNNLPRYAPFREPLASEVTVIDADRAVVERPITVIRCTQMILWPKA